MSCNVLSGVLVNNIYCFWVHGSHCSGSLTGSSLPGSHQRWGSARLSVDGSQISGGLI